MSTVSTKESRLLGKADFLYENKTEQITGAAIEVHKVLGCGFLEAVFQEALAHEFILRKIPFERNENRLSNIKIIN